MTDDAKTNPPATNGNTPPVDLNSRLMRQGSGGGVTPGGKERDSVSMEVKKAPEVQVEVIPSSPEIEKKPELSGYIEQVEKAAELTSPVVDDYTGQVLMNPAQQTPKQIILPLTEAQVQEGLQHQVWEGIRWLAEWCVRQIKLLQGRAMYKSS